MDDKDYLLVGLTGGIACGKSTVSNLLEKKYGAFIIDADKINHELCSPGEIIHAKLALTFTEENTKDKYFNTDNTLNRKALADLIFNNKEVKGEIEQMMHKEIMNEIMLRLGAAVKDGNKLIVLDVPLLVEVGLHEFVDKVIVVSASESEQLKRLMKRNNLTTEQALVRINAQRPVNELIKYAHYVINNNTKEYMERDLDNAMLGIYLSEKGRVTKWGKKKL